MPSSTYGFLKMEYIMEFLFWGDGFHYRRWKRHFHLYTSLKTIPQASTLPLNKPGNSGSSGWITCSAVVHNCSWSRTQNFARGAIWLRGFVRRQILNVYSGRCFSWKTSRYCSATGNWPWVIMPWLYLLPGFFHLWSHQLGCCYISLSWQRRNSSPLLPSAYQRHCCYVFCLLPHLEKAILKYT